MSAGRRAARAVGLVLLVVNGWSCNPIGPNCLSRQERGTVATIQGEIRADSVVSHLVAYGSQGSQNNVDVNWPNQSASDGARLAFYATRAECSDFKAVLTQPAGVCGILGRAGWADGHLVTGLVIASGRGNPDILGSPPQFKVWVVGDSAKDASYTIQVTWFYGPDC